MTDGEPDAAEKLYAHRLLEENRQLKADREAKQAKCDHHIGLLREQGSLIQATEFERGLILAKLERAQAALTYLADMSNWGINLLADRDGLSYCAFCYLNDPEGRPMQLPWQFAADALRDK